MKEGRRRRSRGSWILVPALVGSLVAGASFIGIALASQRSAPPAPSGPEVPLSTPSPAQHGLSSDPTNLQDPIVSKVLPASAPVALDIQAIDVHSDLHDVGLDATGAIEAPSGALYDQAAWYEHSPMPGSMGPAIILGHVDSAANGPSVFFRLGELERGDVIAVTRADGSIARFVVDTVRSYSKDAFPTELVYGDLDHAGLRLVTCGGAFDEVAGHYRDNVVVFATLDLGSS